ncbi:hypothetical protein GCM10023201_50330 [Actinomycetospora corticicola]|uniref:Uncharacterized protein n=1 Tax=Actinomycetospora corticicola TaxID=663602 RepID=A0A7Y9DYS2_9PSEU|nr:hypothetical protein [Actinomycetospora corticicola]NYD37697.1 hypothetical protein [Actinomycetospora corticicola]
MSTLATSERTGVENLLVAVDIGERPRLGQVSTNSSLLAEIYAECFEAMLTHNFTDLLFKEPRPQPDLWIKRMSLASPWEVVLSEALRGTPIATGAAVGYGALRAMKYVLDYKMRWDNHKVERTRKELDNERERLRFSIEASKAFEDAFDLEWQRHPNSPPGYRQLADNVYDLAPLLEVKSVSDDDPRS